MIEGLFCHYFKHKISMGLKIKIILIKFFLILILFLNTFLFADNHNIYEILDQIQKDIKTLEKAVYSNHLERVLFQV